MNESTPRELSETQRALYDEAVSCGATHADAMDRATTDGYTSLSGRVPALRGERRRRAVRPVAARAASARTRRRPTPRYPDVSVGLIGPRTETRSRS